MFMGILECVDGKTAEILSVAFDAICFLFFLHVDKL